MFRSEHRWSQEKKSLLATTEIYFVETMLNKISHIKKKANNCIILLKCRICGGGGGGARDKEFREKIKWCFLWEPVRRRSKREIPK
jgi:hypothetical protein